METKMTKKNILYFACSWFSTQEKEFMEKGQQALKQNPTVDWENTFRPLEHQYHNIDVSQHPEALADPAWQMGTFRNDLFGIDRADFVCGLFLPQKPDSGMAFEYGYAYATHTPIVSVIPDDDQSEINLMLLPSVTRYLHLSELATFDFNQIEFDLFSATAF
ncbi:nucleoside 2-deoxyribosyltransferase [Bombilactobacillus bombi]|nr:nucleoside 2-deoxyribosyltransferase [Bombilactobacillus bombi]